MTNLTRHAEARMRQRGFREGDVSLVLAAATPLANDAWLLTNSDTDREIAIRKREIEQLQRLRGCKVVLGGDSIITVYHTRLATQRQALRKARNTK